MNYTNRLGEITELRCRLDFAKRGIVLSQPTNPSSRYDFIADIGGKLIRIQCKTCHLETEKTIAFSPFSRNWNSRETHQYTNEIDYFYTNWYNQGYLVDINACNNKCSISIRIKDCNEYINKKDSSLYASNIELDAIIKIINPEFEYEIIDLEAGSRLHAKSVNCKRYLCVQCGEPTSAKDGLCWVCSRRKMNRAEKPQREVLKNQIRTMPFTKVGEFYGKTDNAIRKWCMFYNLPTKSSVIKSISDAEWVNV